jgi:hypothetical protein
MCIHELFLATFLSYQQNNPSSFHHLSAASIKSAAAPLMDLAKQLVLSPTSLSPAVRAAGMHRREGDRGALIINLTLLGNAYDELFSNSKSVYAPFLVIQPYQSEPTWQIPPTIIVGSHHLHTVNAVPDVEKLFKYVLSFSFVIVLIFDPITTFATILVFKFFHNCAIIIQSHVTFFNFIFYFLQY